MSRLLALLLVGLAAASPAAIAAEPRASLPDIEDEVMCTVCGTTLELSDSPQAERQRALIRRLIDRGLTKEEIKDELVVEYGADVLAVPDDEGFDLAAWVVPILGILIAGLLIALWTIRQRTLATDRKTPSIDPADSARIDEELARYDR